MQFSSRTVLRVPIGTAPTDWGSERQYDQDTENIPLGVSSFADDPVRHVTYIADAWNQLLRAYDERTATELPGLEAPISAYSGDIAVDPDTGTVYVTQPDGTVTTVRDGHVGTSPAGLSGSAGQLVTWTGHGLDLEARDAVRIVGTSATYTAPDGAVRRFTVPDSCSSDLFSDPPLAADAFPAEHSRTGDAWFLAYCNSSNGTPVQLLGRIPPAGQVTYQMLHLTMGITSQVRYLAATATGGAVLTTGGEAGSITLFTP